MENSYLKLINDTFGDPKKVTSEKLRAFQSEVLKEVFTLRALMESENPEEREAALNKGVELKTLLENQMKSLSETLGLTPSDALIVADVITGYSQRKENTAVSESPRKEKKTINLVG